MATAAELETVTQLLTLTQGSVVNKTLTVWTYVTDPDTDAVTKTRADLTGATIWLSFWSQSAELFVKRSDDISEIEISAQSGDTLGQATIKFIAGDTEALSPGGLYFWDVHVQLADGRREPVIDRSRATIKDRLMGSYV
jgi:hypothetical protein